MTVCCKLSTTTSTMTTASTRSQTSPASTLSGSTGASSPRNATRIPRSTSRQSRSSSKVSDHRRDFLRTRMLCPESRPCLDCRLTTRVFLSRISRTSPERHLDRNEARPPDLRSFNTDQTRRRRRSPAAFGSQTQKRSEWGQHRRRILQKRRYLHVDHPGTYRPKGRFFLRFPESGTRHLVSRKGHRSRTEGPTDCDASTRL